MSVQSELIRLSEKIRADYKTNSELAEKRDILIEKLRNSKKLPSFEKYNQGSYAMCTGIKPENCEEYDIDVALFFNANKSEYNPIDLKIKIQDILKNHTEYGAEIKNPCVTVTYKKNNQAAYHVDLVIYTYDDKDSPINNRLYIAKGKNEDIDLQSWEIADPKGLVNYVNNKFEKSEEKNQFRRVVRYLKKWRNKNILNIGHESPCSVGLTLLTCDYFKYYEDDDLGAFINVVDEICNSFTYVGESENGRNLYRIFKALPNDLDFELLSDVFTKMSDIQMTNFKDKLDILNKNLEEVRDEIDEMEQYKKLNKIFGDDFEVPGINETAKNQIDFIPNSSASGKLDGRI